MFMRNTVWSGKTSSFDMYIIVFPLWMMCVVGKILQRLSEQSYNFIVCSLRQFNGHV